MAVLTTRKMPSFEGVALGSTAIARLPIGLSYHTLLLTVTNAQHDEVTDITIEANGKSIQTFKDLAELNAWNVQRGRASVTDAADSTVVFAIDFVRYGMRTNGAVVATALGTGISDDPAPVSTLNIKASIADVTTSAGNPALSLKAVQSGPMVSGFIKHIRRFPYPFAGSGVFEVSDVPRGLAINRMLVSEGGVTINDLEIKRDNFTVYHRTDNENQLILSDSIYAENVAGYFVFDPTENGVGDGVFETAGVNDLRIIPNFSASPGTFDVLVEYIGPLGA